MTELIEKTSYEARRKKWQDLMQAKYQSMTRDETDWVLDGIEVEIALQVKQAYRAGMLHFNALDHTLKRAESAMSLHTIEWHKAVDLEGTMSIGDFVTLPSLYLQAKGFKQ